METQTGNLEEFDKYQLYLDSVQSPDTDAEFLFKTYGNLRSKNPRLLREDFCGTYALCCEWVKMNPELSAVGVDLDDEPLNYGKTKLIPQLSDQQRERIKILRKDVMDRDLPRADVINALNFSYYCFKKREDLKAYFANCLATLNEGGILVLDCFGGTDCYEANEHETEYDEFSYYWDQDNYNPVDNTAKFFIHFKMKDGQKRTRVFSYDWRMWSIAEIREIMAEVGFAKSVVYWEGTDEDGEGNGEFSLTEEGEECESWIAYIVGMK